jgi:hypothetical protein
MTFRYNIDALFISVNRSLNCCLVQADELNTLRTNGRSPQMNVCFNFFRILVIARPLDNPNQRMWICRIYILQSSRRSAAGLRQCYNRTDLSRGTCSSFETRLRIARVDQRCKQIKIRILIAFQRFQRRYAQNKSLAS